MVPYFLIHESWKDDVGTIEIWAQYTAVIMYHRFVLFLIWGFSFEIGRGGRVGTHGGTLSSYIVKNIALDKTDDSNPREAILRHAKAAEDNPYWVSPAYSK